MANHFAVFGLEPGPWVDLEALKARFHQLSSDCHPDRVHQAPQAEKDAAQRRYTELNAAYQCLSHTKRRLGHLLALTFGESPQVVEEVPGPLMDQFMEVARLLRAADTLAGKKAGATSPMVKAQLMAETLNLSERLTAYREGLERQIKTVEAALPELAATWETTPDWARVRETYRIISHLGRWSGQLAERVQALIF